MVLHIRSEVLYLVHIQIRYSSPDNGHGASCDNQHKRWDESNEVHQQC